MRSFSIERIAPALVLTDGQRPHFADESGNPRAVFVDFRNSKTERKVCNLMINKQFFFTKKSVSVRYEKISLLKHGKSREKSRPLGSVRRVGLGNPNPEVVCLLA